MRISQIKGRRVVNLLNFFIRQLDPESIDVTLQMFNLAPACDRKDVRRLRSYVSVYEAEYFRN